MAPKRAKKPDAPDDKDDKDDPSWDCNDRNLQLYLIPLKRWLPRQHSQLNNFLRFGYVLNSRQEVVVFDTDHKNQLQSGSFTPGTFEEPWLPAALRIDSEDESESEGSVDYTAPLSSKKVQKQPVPTPTTTATPGLADTRDEQFKISPKALASFDEEVMDSILNTFEDEDTAEEFRDECQSSSRQLLTLLHRKAKSISSTDDSNIEARQDSLYKEGIATVSVKDFNLFKSKYRAFNLSRRSPKSDTQVANDFVQVINRLGENIEARLDAKLDVTRAHGSLKKTVDAIRAVLSKYEANQETNYLVHGKSAGAFIGRDPNKGRDPGKKKPPPRQFDTSKPWKSSDGLCPLKGRGSGCAGDHWKKDCPNPNNVDKRPPQKAKAAAASEPNPLDGKSDLSRSAGRGG